MSTVQQSLRTAPTVRNSWFTIPGATPSQQLQYLTQAITQLDPGAKLELYFLLGGR
jgi:hypothetical protein